MRKELIALFQRLGMHIGCVRLVYFHQSFTTAFSHTAVETGMYGSGDIGVLLEAKRVAKCVRHLLVQLSRCAHFLSYRSVSRDEELVAYCVCALSVEA